MNKLFTKIAGAVLGLTMVIGVGAVVAGNLKEVRIAEASTSSQVALSNGNFANSKITWLEDYATITQEKLSGTTAVSSNYIGAPRVYKGHALIFSAKTNYSLLSISIACNTKYFGNSIIVGTSYSGSTVSGSNQLSADLNYENGGTHKVTSSTGTDKIVFYNSASASNVQLRITSITVEYNSTSSGTEETFTVTYYGNDHTGGTVPIDDTAYISGSSVTVKGEGTLEKAGFEFINWNTKQDGSGEPYGENSTFDIYSDTHLYAQWKELPATGNHYALVKDLQNLNIGDQVIIVAKDYNFAMSTEQKSNNRGQVAISKSGDNINSVSNTVQVLTLRAGKTSGSYAFYAGSGYIYAASSSSNYLRTETTLSANSSWSISISSDGTATIKAQGTNTRNVLQYNQSSSLFACYSSASEKAITIYKYVSSEESMNISSGTLSGYKGTTDNSIKISTVNFIAAENEISISYSVAGIATISSSIENDSITLTTTFSNVGSTVATITVKKHEVSLSITVEKKPIELKGTNSDIEDGTLEVISDGSKTNQITFTVLYEGDDSYTKVSANDSILINNPDNLSVSATNNGETVVIKGLKANADPVTLTFTLKTTIALETPLTYELKVKVTDDYNRYVEEITFNKDLTATQGESVNISEIFASKIAKTYFSKKVEIKNEELLLSYNENDFENAVQHQNFIYDFDHGDILDPTHKLQEIWVYVTFQENFEEVSFTITIEQKSVPLESINLNAEEISLYPNETFQLEVEFNPNDTTESREVIYSVDEENSDFGHSITVNEDGLISAGNKANLTAVIHVESVVNPEIFAEVHVEVLREAIYLELDLEKSYKKITSTDELTDGEYLIVSEGNNVVFNGALATLDAVDNVISTEINNGNISSSTEIDNATFTISKSGSNYSIKSSSGKYIGNSGTSNDLTSSDTSIDNIIIFESNGDVKIAGSEGSVLRYNKSTNNGNRFRYYKSSSYAGQQAIQLYKYSGIENIEITEEFYDLLDASMVYNEQTGYYQLEMCDISGKTSLDDGDWNALSELFSESSIASDNMLAFAKANEIGNIAEQFLAAYDYVVGKYGEEYDFLGRIESGLIVPSNSNINNLIKITENNSSALIIVTISLISVATLGGYFFVRKRKENQ